MVCQLFNSINTIEQDDILICVAEFILDLTVQIDLLIALRDRSNAPISSIFPPIVPSDLILLTSCQFYEVMNKQKERLGSSFTAKQISAIEDEFKSLNRECSSSNYLQIIISERICIKHLISSRQ